ncbi:MAG: hypothetical protein M3N22_09585 [Acidobacteriota bacterium]|nr:hypothetical protein [Acidobacteriota bacterium]
MDHISQSGDFGGTGIADGAEPSRDLFALTDEQILEMEPDAAGDGNTSEAHEAHGTQSNLARQNDAGANGIGMLKQQTGQVRGDGSSMSSTAVTGTAARTNAGTAPTATAATTSTSAVTGTSGSGAADGTDVEPPRWLAQMMADPQSGGEAREFWNGVAQARQDAAAYREVFAKPEAAREAAGQARTLAQIDRAYFAGDTGERSRLAASMMREDPAAFREMVIEGLRALDAAEKQSGVGQANGSRLARAFADAGSSLGSVGTSGVTPEQTSRADGGTGVAGHHGVASQDAQMAAYAAFEKSANEDLERSVGGAIDRTLQQALPRAEQNGGLKGRLAASIRQDVEKALQGDRQLGEQVAQLLAGKRLDGATRSQVVRLIGERADQLVPGAAKRILNDWTQTTLASYRERGGRAAAAVSRTEVVPGAGAGRVSDEKTVRGEKRGVDYRKVSDEQILAM